MFAKLLIIIVALGGAACVMLVHRQQRVELAHDVARTHQRLLQHERVIWELRTEIASRIRPSDVRALVEQMGVEWVPIPESPEFLHQPSLSEGALSAGWPTQGTPSVIPARRKELGPKP